MFKNNITPGGQCESATTSAPLNLRVEKPASTNIASVPTNLLLACNPVSYASYKTCEQTIRSGWSAPIVKAPYILVILAAILLTPFVVVAKLSKVAAVVSSAESPIVNDANLDSHHEFESELTPPRLLL